MGDDILNLNNIAKSGPVKPSDVTLSGELTPKQGRTFRDAIVNSNELLKEVSVEKAGKLTAERSGWEIAKGMLGRHVSGESIDDDKMKKLGKIGCNLDMTKGASLNVKILEDTLENNQDNKNFADEQYEKFAIAMGNDLNHLGIIGEADNANKDAPFKELAKGWVHIAKTSENTNKASSSNGSILYRLKHLVVNAHDDVKGEATIFMSNADYMEYQFEIAEKYKDLATLLSADKKQFMNHPIKTRSDFKNGEYLLTPIKNMVFGISSKIKRDRWWDSEKSCLRYKFVAYVDYEFDIHKYVTFMNVVDLTITSYETTVAVDATSQRIVQVAGGEGIAGVTVVSADTDIATVTYASDTGVIEITGVAVGTTKVTVDDGTSTKDISVTVTA